MFIRVNSNHNYTILYMDAISKDFFVVADIGNHNSVDYLNYNHFHLLISINSRVRNKTQIHNKTIYINKTF